MAGTRNIVIGIVVALLALQLALGAVRTFYVQETDFVQLQPQTVDPDNDKVSIRYSEPFDERGRWQTGYDDAGTHDVTITASDGINQTTETVKVIVANKNQPPYLTERKVIVKETELINLKEIVVDPDDDPLEFTFTPPFNKNGEWFTGYNDEGNFVTSFTVTDGEFTTRGRVEITVMHTNQPPIVESTFSTEQRVNVNEGETLGFSVDAHDSDGNDVTYFWTFDGGEVSTENEGTFYIDYNSSGKHALQVTVGDGEKETTREWDIIVKDVNRKPTLELETITADEGITARFTLPPHDQDGDELTYTFEEPFTHDGTWNTTYDDAGTHRITVTVTDGEFTESGTARVVVNDVDRAPVLHLPEGLVVYEGGELSWTIDTHDPDGDRTSVEVEGLPDTAALRGNTVTWKPDYDAIRRSGGWFSTILNKLRIENFFLRKQTYPITVTSCGKEKCTTKETKFTLHNVNREPILESIANITIHETESLTLTPVANDPDGDLLRYFFTEPLRIRAGTWQTDFDDEGTYTTFVTATDGSKSTTSPVQITVLKTNRAPTLTTRTDKVRVNEGQQFTIQLEAEDPDNDDIVLRVRNPPEGSSFSNGVFVWAPSYESVPNRTEHGFWYNLRSASKALHRRFSNDLVTQWIEFAVTDGEVETVHPVAVEIHNVNRAPIVGETEKYKEALVGEPVLFMVDAVDEDNDKLSYEWSFGFGEEDVTGVNALERTFVTPGKKEVSVTISDNQYSEKKEWEVMVYAKEEPVVEEPIIIEEPQPTFKVYVIRS